ncbi:Ig-like domain-containing protein [Zeaxanthinibacter enoshimensis]|uniref:Ig-like domain-containing protein n=1 Tax=Zeaxanthinibacter enoshimensis TaxID=392009 RepID=A0A4R6TP88_9FLAO|nr:Ig-like domain-containing protein [Zeaxanthinibacter enoshimensis]TDQ33105.1 Ig-like domain-containing protein [Zeaxanthinibacter enoshimensis]
MPAQNRPMALLRRSLMLMFALLLVAALLQCAKRGSPSGGPKDVEAPVMIDADPDNLSVNFKSNRIRLYFDEYIKLQDVQNQLIISPPLKYAPEIKPQGGASKFIEIILKDTLRDSTTYTINFGQSIVDNNEGNPNPFLTYVFSTGDYIDSLTLSGVVKDAFNRNADKFISVMLYELDSSYTDSTIYNEPPNYMTNTLDSTTIFRLNNLKAGKYVLVGVKDEAKNNVFNQDTDKIAFVEDTIQLPTDTTYLLNMFREIPDYSMLPPSLAAANRVLFGYQGEDPDVFIEPLTQLPDSVKTMVSRIPGKDSLNFWFTPFKADSLVFRVRLQNTEQIDTFTVKTRKLGPDTLLLNPSHRSKLPFEETFSIGANTPIIAVDRRRISVVTQDSVPLPFQTELDTLENRVRISFEKDANTDYRITLDERSLMDFFGQTNDSVFYRLSTGGYADLGNLRMRLEGELSFPLIVQLTDEKGTVKRERYLTGSQLLEFNNVDPGKYLVRLIFDTNENKRWDTGRYLERRQPEKVIYYPEVIEVRANWELEQTFTVGG